MREWFLNKKDDKYNDELREVDIALNLLLELYLEAITKYFNISISKNVLNFIELVKQKELDPGDRLFIEWFQKKGLPSIKSILSEDIMNDKNLINEIEYQRYILENEMDFSFKDDVRTCLVDIANNLLDRTLCHFLKENYSLEKEKDYPLPKIKETAEQSPLLVIGGVFY